MLIRRFHYAACLLAILIPLFHAGCGNDNSPTSPSALPSGNSPVTTFVSFVSGPGDPVGQAFTRRFALDSAVFQTFVNDSQSYVRVAARPFDGSELWTLNVAGPGGQPLSVGTYSDVVLYSPGPPAAAPALSFLRSGHSCLRVTGRFAIRELVVGPANTLDRFHATFEQFCNGAASALTGEFRIVANPWR